MFNGLWVIEGQAFLGWRVRRHPACDASGGRVILHRRQDACVPHVSILGEANGRCSMVDVQWSMFNVQWSMFNVQWSMVNVQCSPFLLSSSLIVFVRARIRWSHNSDYAPADTPLESHPHTCRMPHKRTGDWQNLSPC